MPLLTAFKRLLVFQRQNNSCVHSEASQHATNELQTVAIGWLNQSYWTGNEFVPVLYRDQLHKPCEMCVTVRLPRRCKWDLRSFGILHSVEWQFATDVSGQPIGPIFKGQAVQEECQEHLGTQCVTRGYTLPPLTHHSALRRLAKGFILKPTIRTHLDILKISRILHFICIRTGLMLSCSLLLVFLYLSKAYFNFVLSHSLFQWHNQGGYDGQGTWYVWGRIYTYIHNGFGRQPWRTENTRKTYE